MKQLSGGQAAVASLQAEKVEQVFGLIGSATMEIFDALYDATPEPKELLRFPGDTRTLPDEVREKIWEFLRRELAL